MIEPVIIGNATLYHGRAEDVVSLLDQPIDGVVSDPQYVFETSGGGEFRKSRPGMDEIADLGLDQGFDPHVIYDAVKRGAKSVLLFYHYDQIFDIAEIFKTISCEFKTPRHAGLFWQKSNPMPVANGHFQPEFEYIWHGWDKDFFKVEGDSLADKKRAWLGPVGKNEYGHPTQKPIPLMVKLIKNASRVGDVVLDPYMGTGSTGVACGFNGRKFIGIEKEKTWFDVAVRRCRQAFLGPPVGDQAPMATNPSQEGFDL